MHFLCNMRCFAQFFCARSLSRPARGGWIEIWRGSLPAAPTMSRPARGGWIEIPASRFPWPESSGPAPQGASGLKFAQPGRAALWTRPAPQGAGGLKFCSVCAAPDPSGPAPQGAGGLKCRAPETSLALPGSRPARGEWIEIIARRQRIGLPRSRPARGGITIFWQVFSCNVRHRISETAHYEIWTAAGICRGPESYFMLRS